MTDLISIALRGAVMALVLVAAWEDVRHMRIRNDLTIAVALLFIPLIFILPWREVSTHLIIGVIFFIVAAGMFFMRMIGGGDAKLLAALGLWPQLSQLPGFLMVMTMAGGLLALAALGLKRAPFLPKLAEKTPVDGWFASLARGETVVPYGVAIAVACALTFF